MKAKIYLCAILILLVANQLNAQDSIKNVWRLPYYPSLYYEKLDSDFLKDNSYQGLFRDWVKRSNFDIYFTALHEVDKKINYHNPDLISALQTSCGIIHNAGKKFVMDIDIRNEEPAFLAKYPGKSMKFVRFFELDLDKEGKGSIIADPISVLHWDYHQTVGVSDLLNAWCFKLKEKGQFEKESLVKITDQIDIVKLDSLRTKISVKKNKMNAGKRTLIAVTFSSVLPDFFAPEFLPNFDNMFQQAKAIPFDGAFIDEFGIFSNVPNDGQIQSFPYSENMAIQYHQNYGLNLNDQLIYFRYASDNLDPNQIKAINYYLEYFRNRLGQIETWFYNKTKMVFGKDAFVAVHPTWISNKKAFRWEYLYNGFDWWQAKRDYGFTDEQAPYSIRLALAHKWGSNIWYNMYYGDENPDIHTFYKETWDNARFGGRTFYLGFDGKLVTWKLKNYFDSIAPMEERIQKINQFQLSPPDSKIAIVFGMEGSGNWILHQPGSSATNGIDNAVNLSEQLIKSGYLCDVIPSSELEDASLKIIDKKVHYGNQVYDGVIVCNPEYVKKGFLSFLNTYQSGNQNLVMIGSTNFYFDGTFAGKDFESFKEKIQYYFDTVPSDDQFLEIFKKWNVSKTSFSNGFLLMDGSAIFTANMGNASDYKNYGNALTVDQTIKGHHVVFNGEDFMCIDLDKKGALMRYAAGKTNSLKIDGKEIDVKTLIPNK